MQHVSPYSVLRERRVWIVNAVILGTLAFLFAVLYIGANVDPVDDLHELPIGLVNADQGAPAAGMSVNLGSGIPASIRAAGARSDKFEWKVMSEEKVRDQLARASCTAR